MLTVGLRNEQAGREMKGLTSGCAWVGGRG